MKTGKTYIIFIFVLFIIPLKSSAEDKKIYSEKEFQQAVMNEIKKKIEKVQTSNLSSFSKSLLDKEDKLRERERLLDARVSQLEMVEKDFTERIKQFKSKQDKFLGCIDENKKKQSERIGRLVEIIGGMKASKAAELLSIQEPDLAIKILGTLDPLKTSKIFNLMDKEISARLQKQYMVMKQ